MSSEPVVSVVSVVSVAAAKFVDGDVVKYTPYSDWCHHGIAVVHVEEGKTWATDTYWGLSPTDGSYVRVEDLDPANIIGNLHLFGKVPYLYYPADFADNDTYFVPMGGGSSYHRVRIGAVPVPERVRERLVHAVENAESEVRSANWQLKSAQKELAAFDKERT